MHITKLKSIEKNHPKYFTLILSVTQHQYTTRHFMLNLLSSNRILPISSMRW